MRGKSGPRSEIVAYRMTPAERRELRLLARAEGTTMSGVIRRAVRERAERMAGDGT